MNRIILLCRKCGQAVESDSVEFDVANSPGGVYLTITGWCKKCKLPASYKFKGN